MPHNGICDGCGDGREKRVHKLSVGVHGNLFLCKKCWNREMRWRKERNKELERQNRFSILKWPE